MDELEKKAQKGLKSFTGKDDLKLVKDRLDGMIDDMLGDDGNIRNSEKGGNKKMNWLYIVLAILGLCLVGYLGYHGANQENEVNEPAVLYAQYFEVLPDAVSANERGSDASSDLISDADLGMAYYNKGDFKRAATILSQQDEVEYLVFGAIAEMKNNNSKAALDLLLESKEMLGAEKYLDIIIWYGALAYLKNENLELAKQSLILIADGNHYKKKEAKAILQSLK